MDNNQRVEFWQSEKLSDLCIKAINTGLFCVDNTKLKFDFPTFTESIAYRGDNDVVKIWPGLEKMAIFVDDVVNDRFDLTTLKKDYLDNLNKWFGDYEIGTNLITTCYKYVCSYKQVIMTLPIKKYFTFLKHENIICLSDPSITPERAYEIIERAINVAIKYKELEKYYTIFCTKVNTAYNERELIKKLDT